MAIPDYTLVEDWDIVFLASMRMPGVASVSVKIPSGIDKRKARGSRKGRAKDKGEPQVEFEVQLELQPDELDEFQAALDKLRFVRVGTTKQPFAIAHPQASIVGVTLVILGAVKLPHPKTGGTYLAALELIEWKPPKNLKESAKKPAPDNFGTEADVDALINALSPANFESAERNFSFDPNLYQNQSNPTDADLFTPG